MSRLSLHRHKKQGVLALLFLAIMLFSPPSMGEAAGGDTSSALAITRLYAQPDIVIGGRMLDKDALKAFYAARNYRLAWDAEEIGLGARASLVFAALRNADEEGLDPADYHVDQIATRAAAVTDAERLERDLLISDGLLRYAADVAGGKLTAKQTDERAANDRIALRPDILASIASLDPEQLSIFLDGLPPATPEYLALKAMLPTIASLIESGGWGVLPDGGTLRPGMRDPVVPVLRQRLIAEKILSPDGQPAHKSDEDIYDRGLSTAVALFQKQHGLKPDGVIGKDSRVALDMSADARLRQTVVNMERVRWIAIPATGRMVEVNLAAYALKVFQDGTPIMTMAVVVGTPENPTPIISSRITTVVLNPNWTLPPNVIREILPRMSQNVNYLAERGIAREVDDGRTRLVQPPGPTNPLGRYKFVMPNDQDIYLHDSPDAAKFHYAARAYSHGCVRLADPAGLAALLLDDRIDKLPASLDDLVQLKTTRHISLSKPVPVSLVYRTAWLDPEGNLVLGSDSYGRDPKLWKALHKPRPVLTHKVAERGSLPETFKNASMLLTNHSFLSCHFLETSLDYCANILHPFHQD